jgi:hypothetical protein
MSHGKVEGMCIGGNQKKRRLVGGMGAKRRKCAA